VSASWYDSSDSDVSGASNSESEVAYRQTLIAFLRGYIFVEIKGRVFAGKIVEKRTCHSKNL
jgi:hypothetical protein